MPLRNYAAWCFVATAYMFAFMQRMAPQSINHHLMTDFNVAATGVSFIASAYFWGYTLMQIPAGPLVDRFGLRRVIIVSTLVSTIGCGLFAGSRNTSTAFVARFILACGDALVFTSLIKMVALYFKDGKFGLMSGLSQASGYIGGALAAAPLAWLVGKIDWHSSFFLFAVAELGVFAGCYLCIERTDDTTLTPTRGSDLLKAVNRTIRGRHFFAIAAINASHFSVMIILAGVWGISMLTHYFKIDSTVAGTSFVAFMIGNIVGSIVVGRLVDYVGNTQKLLGWMFIVRIICLAMLIPSIARTFGLFWVTLDLFGLGFVSGGAIPAILASVKKIFTISYMSTGASICMTIAGVFTAMLLPLVGASMSSSKVQTAVNGGDLTLTDHSYLILIAILGFISTLGLLGVVKLGGESRLPQEE
jgi:MFS family permease